MTQELQLINSVLDLLKQQAEYFKQRKFGYQATQQLELCKKKEHALRSYCTKRKKEIESKQQDLFTNQ